MRRYAGRVITKNSVAPTTNAASAAKGIWTLDEAAQYKKDGKWPIQIVQVDQVYNTAGTYTFVVPSCITSISMVAVGPGGQGANGFSNYVSGYVYCCYFGQCVYVNYTDYAGGGAGGGGGLGYRNNYSVSPGQSFTVTVLGSGGASANPATGIGGIARAYGGNNASLTNGGSGGYGFCGGSGFYGGGGGSSYYGGCGYGVPGGGGGGAAGYTGQGGNGGSPQNSGTQSYGTGGGGGGGGTRLAANNTTFGGGGGGGVGLYGSYNNGAAGYSTYYGDSSTPTGGGGSSPGTNGTAYYGVGGIYGGGGAGAGYSYGGNLTGGTGGVRIIAPGTTRTFPNNAQAN